MQFRRIGQLVAATTVSAVALSGAQAVAQENKTTISVTNITDTVSYTHLTLPTIALLCRSRWSPYH